MIRIRDLDFTYRGGDFRLAIDALDVASGTAAAVVGPSGSGKTTWLHLLAGILVPDAADRVDEVEVSALDDRRRREFRIRQIGMVFQEFELLDHLSVLDNVLLPYRITPALDLDGDVRERAAELGERVGLGDKLRGPPRRLSQGERQRVGVCRALLPDPPLLFADEPTGNLDPDTRSACSTSCSRTRRTQGDAPVTVTHDHDLLDRFDRVIDVDAGATWGRRREATRSTSPGATSRTTGQDRVLVASITLILFVPAGLRVLVSQSEAQLTARAEATPLLVGTKGSPLELVLELALLRADVPERMPLRARPQRVRDTGLALAIPLYVRFRARDDPIVGTTLDYFGFRGLGSPRRRITRLGDCVLGARVADGARLGPGDHVVSSPETVFDLAGVYPLKMRVTGVLAPAGDAGRRGGLRRRQDRLGHRGPGHGHADLTEPGGRGACSARGTASSATRRSSSTTRSRRQRRLLPLPRRRRRSSRSPPCSRCRSTEVLGAPARGATRRRRARQIVRAGRRCMDDLLGTS